ncbi:MAG: hypothetical protein ACI9X4_001781, partial [Glaciecola sp.]
MRRKTLKGVGAMTSNFGNWDDSTLDLA